MFKVFLSCCAYNTTIAVIASVLMYFSIRLHMIHDTSNMIIMMLTFVIYLEVSKLVVEMLISDEAAIKIRYAYAMLALASTREVYIAMIEKDAEWILIYSVVTVFFMLMRSLSIKMTKEGR